MRGHKIVVGGYMTQRDSETASIEVQRFEDGSFISKADRIVTEEPLEIRLATAPNIAATRQSITVTMRTPGNDFELAAGFLFTEGIINDPDSIESISHPADEGLENSYNIVEVVFPEGCYFDASSVLRNFYTTSSCGVCGKASLDAVRVNVSRLPSKYPLKVYPNIVSYLPDKLRDAQALFKNTGGLHASGIFTASGELVSLREDVGRHNALDKLIGEQFLARRVPLTDSVLVLSGRASFELVQKAAVAGIPMIVAVGAPSTLAVELAQEFDITLVGFAKQNSFNVYCGMERISYR